MTTAVSDVQRLRTREGEIREAADAIQRNGLKIGLSLLAIRDDELWKAGYPSWDQYLKLRAPELIGRSFAQAARLIRAAEVSKRLPADLSSVSGTELRAGHLDELARLAPNVGQGNGQGVEKDYARLRTADVGRVLEAAGKAAGDRPVSVRDLRNAVDKDLGIDRAAERKAADERLKKLQEATEAMRREAGQRERERNEPELGTHLFTLGLQLEKEAAVLAQVPEKDMKLNREKYAFSFESFATAVNSFCNALGIAPPRELSRPLLGALDDLDALGESLDLLVAPAAVKLLAGKLRRLLGAPEYKKPRK
jgi:hypothetical protein